ncbi:MULTISPECIES: GNAT family N-acetyltransferase [Chromobacterium]|uniref:GNAT family N-acetyltransferase n=1 Tax=Chromobacterium TaxID=535 RepID=UPI000D2FA7C3|nr:MULTISPECIES: GNAT family N-acetyltransferase [Chromobacterium]PTU67433.1 N-acetyltransferase [Chromobacterium sp. Panama]
MVEIRTMRAADAAAAARLCLDLGYEATEADISERFARLTTLPDNQVWVALWEGAVVGWIHGHGVHLLEASPAMEIGGLVVSPSHQGRGLGKQLLRACEDWARRLGYPRMRLRSGVHRDAAHAFYRHLGYVQQKTSHGFVLDLTDGQ